MVITAVTSCFAACDPPDDRSDVGVGIVPESPLGLHSAPGATWALSAEPRLILGDGTDESPVFHRVDQAITLPDGSVVVVDRGNAHLHRFDDDGRLLASMGGMGFGPGEFRTIAGMVPLGGDTILALDPATMRMTVLAGDGAVLATHGVTAPDGNAAGLSTYRLVGRWGAERIVLAPGGVVVWARPRPEAFTESNPILVYDLVGRLLGELPREWRLEMWGDEATSLVRPFGKRTIARVRAGSFYLADPYTGWVERWEGGSQPVEVLELGGPRMPVSTDVREAWIEVRVGGIEQAAARRAQRRRLERVPFPGHLPSFEDLEVGPTGRLWVRELTLPGRGGPSRWTILDADGTPVARIKVPAELRLLEINEDRLLGLWTDSLGSQTVRSHVIRRD